MEASPLEISDKGGILCNVTFVCCVLPNRERTRHASGRRERKTITMRYGDRDWGLLTRHRFMSV
jgi:hypothetical protein